MRKVFTLALLLSAIISNAQVKFTYAGQQITTSKNNIYVNPKKKNNAKVYIYNNVKDALRCAESLQEARSANDTTWTNIYIEPSVYWIDNPNDTTTHMPLPGEHIPYGMKLKLNNRKITGISPTLGNKKAHINNPLVKEEISREMKNNTLN